MKKYLVKYWRSGDIRLHTIEASDIVTARILFETSVPNDDVISISEAAD